MLSRDEPAHSGAAPMYVIGHAGSNREYSRVDMAARDHERDPIRVLLVDDHRSFAEALGMAIERVVDVLVVGVVTSVSAALDVVANEPVDVVVIDWQLPDVDGIDGIRRLKLAYPSLAAIMVTGHADPRLQRLAIDAGVDGFLGKESSVSAVLDAVRACSRGEITLTFDDADAEPTTEQKRLTPRQTEILWMLARGNDINSIAADLFLSVHTVRTYVKQLLRDLGARSQLEAVVIAQSRNLIPHQPRRPDPSDTPSSAAPQ